VYIGKAGSAGGLRERLTQYHFPGTSQLTNRRILQAATDDGTIEVGWIETDLPDDLEARLLFGFRREFGTLPMWNRVMPRRPTAESEDEFGPPDSFIEYMRREVKFVMRETGRQIVRDAKDVLIKVLRGEYGTKPRE
jgi:hypothetical protein